MLDEVELIEAQGWLNSPDAEALGYDEVLTELIEASGRRFSQPNGKKKRLDSGI